MPLHVHRGAEEAFLATDGELAVYADGEVRAAPWLRSGLALVGGWEVGVPVHQPPLAVDPAQHVRHPQRHRSSASSAQSAA